MAKKIVRGITDVKTINNQDFDTNNVNDLLSDGQYNYIHRKKGKNEEYHNLTDNIKTLSSDNTELLTVTNNNKTTNTATLHPKHDNQKEQVLESTRATINIHHGENGTAEKTTVDTNPQKVLEHSNLLTDYGISKNTTGNTTKLGLEYTLVENRYDLNNLLNGCVRGPQFLNAPKDNTWYYVSSFSEGKFTIQEAITLAANKNTTYKRTKQNNIWGEWREQVGDKSVIDGLLAQKEQLLESTRDTITINHGTNGTDEKTTVDTNPEKVLEHENLISDSEYITLNHQTGDTTTHIKTESLKQELQQLHQTKQDTLTAGDGITIHGNTISASGGAPVEGETSSFKFFHHQDEGGIFDVYKHTITQPFTNGGTSGRLTFTRYTFNGVGVEIVLTGELKEELESCTRPNRSISNSALTITNDGTNIKLTNSATSQDTFQQAIFTFYSFIPDGGGLPPVGV